MAAKKSWWRARRIKHRDTVVLAVLAASLLLAGEFVNNDIPHLIQTYIMEPPGVASNAPLIVVIIALVILGFTTYFGGIFVLLGGMHFSWGRVGRGRFLVGLGIGMSLLGFVGRMARATLDDRPVLELITIASSLTGLGLLFGLASHSLMSQYALMLKKHGRNVFQRWRRSRRSGREYELRPHRLRT
ncbi:MAG TPA: hypothetical protein VK723_04910 [Thermoplasmata archaeon]|nr:hypothetical protein [Thermoplasmata archaeon]